MIKENRENLKRYLFEIIKNSKGKIIIAFLLMICTSGCSLLQPQLIKKIIDRAVPDKNFRMLIFIIIVYMLLSIIVCVFNFILKILCSVMKRSISIKFKNKLIHQLSNMQPVFWENKRIGEILKILDDDIFNIENFGIETILTIFYQILTAIVAFILLFSMQPVILFVVVVLEYIEIMLQLHFTKKIIKRTSEVRNIAGDCFSILEEFISNMVNIVISKAKLLFWHKLIDTEKIFKRESIILDMNIEISSNLNDLLHTLTILSIYLWGGVWTIQGKMTIGTLIIYIEYVTMFTGPICNIIRLNSAIQQTKVSLKRIYQILDTKPDIMQNNQGIKHEEKINSIVFNDVYFSYSKKEEVLKNVKLNFKRGTITGIVGNTGCGKSTVVRLLYRLWEIDSGEILIDNISIKEYNLYYLRKQISIISQDILIFNDTIWNNIVCSSKKDRNTILNICKNVGIEEFVQKLDKKYETVVGEHGIKLSGGQKQKIAIARALINDGTILIMDEATSAIDNISQKNIMDNIQKYLTEKIVIIIAHRLSIVKNADKIFVMKHGEVVGYGSHNDLISNCLEYQELIAAEEQDTGNRIYMR